MIYISAEIRRLVAERAGRRCEYCLIHEDDTFLGCEVDHIISKKHGGSNEPENLAYACLFCNRHKGTDIGSIHPNTGKLMRFYGYGHKPGQFGKALVPTLCVGMHTERASTPLSLQLAQGCTVPPCVRGRFYNPRKDRWGKHFQLNDVIIEPLTGIGEVTVRLFVFNNPERLLEREALVSIGAYPAPSPTKQKH